MKVKPGFLVEYDTSKPDVVVASVFMVRLDKVDPFPTSIYNLASYEGATPEGLLFNAAPQFFDETSDVAVEE